MKIHCRDCHKETEINDAALPAGKRYLFICPNCKPLQEIAQTMGKNWSDN